MSSALIVIALGLAVIWVVGRVLEIIGFAIHLLLLAAAVLLVIGLISH